MVVLDMHPYDAILGYDWLQQHSLMQCDWVQKTGISAPREISQVARASTTTNATKGNDIWEFVLLDYIPEPPLA